MTNTDWRDDESRTPRTPHAQDTPGRRGGPRVRCHRGLCPGRIRTVQTYGIWGGKCERDLRKVRAARGLIQPAKRVPVDEVYRLSDLGRDQRQIASVLGCHVDSVRRLLKLRRQNEAVV